MPEREKESLKEPVIRSQKIQEQPKRDIKEYHGASKQKVKKTKSKDKNSPLTEDIIENNKKMTKKIDILSNIKPIDKSKMNDGINMLINE